MCGEGKERRPFILSEEKASMIRHPVRRRNMEEGRKEKE
jgi:hypothetical protein